MTNPLFGVGDVDALQRHQPLQVALARQALQRGHGG
jgi:hypothetical protein